MDRIAKVLELIVAGQQKPAIHPRDFQRPEFEGKGDIEYFIQKISQVAETNA